MLNFYHFTLCNQLSGIKLCHDRFEDFVGDGGQHSIIVVQAQGGEYIRQSVGPFLGMSVLVPNSSTDSISVSINTENSHDSWLKMNYKYIFACQILLYFVSNLFLIKAKIQNNWNSVVNIIPRLFWRLDIGNV